MSYQSMEEAQLRCEKEGIEFWKAVQLEDADERGVTEEDSWKEMKRMWQAMLDGLDAYDPELMSRSRMVGREGGRLPGGERYIVRGFHGEGHEQCAEDGMQQCLYEADCRRADSGGVRRDAGGPGHILQGV